MGIRKRVLLIALDRHDPQSMALAQDCRQASVSDSRVDDLHRLALEAVGYLLEGPAGLVLERALDELLYACRNPALTQRTR